MFGCGPMEYDTDSSSGGLAEAGNYVPSASATNVAASTTIPYEWPPAWDGGENCGGGILPGAQRLSEYLKQTYSGVSLVGGYNCRSNTANSQQTSVHGTGRALDIMIPTIGGQADNTVGDQIANWLITNSAALGVQYLIWDRTEYTTSGGTRVRNYTGPNPHVDHIHMELQGATASNSTLQMPGASGFGGAFEFSANYNSVAVCANAPVTQGDANGWEYSCANRQTVFQPGSTMYGFVRVANVKKNIRFRVEAWRAGQETADWGWEESTFRDVGQWGWSKTHFIPQFSNVTVGDWEMKIYADVGNGFIQVTSLYFIVPGAPVQQFPGTPYEYHGSQYHCKGGVVGGQSTNYVYTCNDQRSVYTEGDTVSTLVRIDNVTVRHRFQSRIFKNGQYQYASGMSGWNEVSAGQVWAHAYTWADIPNIQPGTYEIRVDVDTDNNDQNGFSNVNVAIISYTVNALPRPDYDPYNGNAYLCRTVPTGGTAPSYTWTCPAQAGSVFGPNDTVYPLLYLTNMRKSYSFRANYFLNGSTTPAHVVPPWYQAVPAGEVWGRVYTWPSIWHPAVGNWRVQIEVMVEGGSWQNVTNIPFTVVSETLDLCRGDYSLERGADGVPGCNTPMNLSSDFYRSTGRYYWRQQFGGLTTSYRFRLEAWRGGTMQWGYNYGPFPARADGTGWFFPEFNAPAAGSWELRFFIDRGNGTFTETRRFNFTSYN